MKEENVIRIDFVDGRTLELNHEDKEAQRRVFDSIGNALECKKEYFIFSNSIVNWRNVTQVNILGK